MRIIHVATRASGGGTNLALRGVIEFERSLGHDSRLLVGGISHEYADLTVPLLRRELNPLRDLLAGFALRRELVRLSPDIVHSHESKAGLLTRLFLSPRRYLLVHTVHMATFSSIPVTIFEKITIAVERFLARRTHKLVFVGEDLQSIYVKNEIHALSGNFILRSRIDIDEFELWSQSKTDAKIMIRELIGLEPDSKIVISVGLLEKRKRHALIIDLLAPMLRDEEIHLVICGEGNQRAALVRRSAELNVSDKVHLVGYQRELAPWLAGADLVVHASNLEGVSQVLLQAAATNTPAIAAEVAGMSELVDVLWITKSCEGLLRHVNSVLKRNDHSYSQDFSKWDPGEISRRHTDFLQELENLNLQRHRAREI